MCVCVFFLLQPVQLLFCDLLPLSLSFTSLLLSLCLAFDLAFCTSWPLIKDSNHSFLFHFVIIIIRYSIYSLYSTVSQACDALTPIPSFIHKKKTKQKPMRIFSIAFFNVVLCNLLRIVSRYSLIQQRRPYLAGVNQIFIIPSFAFFFLSFIYLLAILPEYI